MEERSIGPIKIKGKCDRFSNPQILEQSFAHIEKIGCCPLIHLMHPMFFEYPVFIKFFSNEIPFPNFHHVHRVEIEGASLEGFHQWSLISIEVHNDSIEVESTFIQNMI